MLRQLKLPNLSSLSIYGDTLTRAGDPRSISNPAVFLKTFPRLLRLELISCNFDGCQFVVGDLREDASHLGCTSHEEKLAEEVGCKRSVTSAAENGKSSRGLQQLIIAGQMDMVRVFLKAVPALESLWLRIRAKKSKTCELPNLAHLLLPVHLPHLRALEVENFSASVGDLRRVIDALPALTKGECSLSNLGPSDLVDEPIVLDLPRLQNLHLFF